MSRFFALIWVRENQSPEEVSLFTRTLDQAVLACLLHIYGPVPWSILERATAPEDIDNGIVGTEILSANQTCWRHTRPSLN